MAAHERGKNIVLNKLTHAGAALVMAGSLAACRDSETPAVCESPRATSRLFSADPKATKDRTTWEAGIAIRTEVPTDAESIIVGFRRQNASNWTDSLPVSPDRARMIAVLLGDGAVSFSVHTIAAEGSAACTGKPPVKFGEPQSMQPLIDGDATLPRW